MGHPPSCIDLSAGSWHASAAGGFSNGALGTVRSAPRRKCAASTAVHGVHAGRRNCWLCLGHHRSWRRNIPCAACPVVRLGGDAPGICGFHGIQSSELSGSACWGLGNDPGIPGAAAVVAGIRWIGSRHRFMAWGALLTAQSPAGHLGGASIGFWPAHDLGVIEILLHGCISCRSSDHYRRAPISKVFALSIPRSTRGSREATRSRRFTTSDSEHPRQIFLLVLFCACVSRARHCRVTRQPFPCHARNILMSRGEPINPRPAKGRFCLSDRRRSFLI